MRTSRVSRLSVIILLTAFASVGVGCSEDPASGSPDRDSGTPTPDAQVVDGGTLDATVSDAQTDAQADAQPDAQADARADAQTDAQADAQTDAQADAQTDAQADGG